MAGFLTTTADRAPRGDALECWFTVADSSTAARLAEQLERLGCRHVRSWDFVGRGPAPQLPWTVLVEADRSVDPVALSAAAFDHGGAYHPLGGADRWAG